MYIINFSHPLNEAHLARIEELANEKITVVREIPVQIDNDSPLEPQIVALADAVGFTQQEWQSHPIVINPPGYSSAAVALLALIHGRIGAFPTVIRMRPRRGPVTSFEVAEIVNLHALREGGRNQRYVPPSGEQLSGTE